MNYTLQYYWYSQSSFVLHMQDLFPEHFLKEILPYYGVNLPCSYVISHKNLVVAFYSARNESLNDIISDTEKLLDRSKKNIFLIYKLAKENNVLTKEIRHKLLVGLCCLFIEIKK